MRRIFTILAFITVTVSLFGQNTDETTNYPETFNDSSYTQQVEEVAAADFAIIGGMVYSVGEIVVYNVAGKAIATASKSFNANSLEAGVYFITAKEGTIKFVK